MDFVFEAALTGVSPRNNINYFLKQSKALLFSIILKELKKSEHDTVAQVILFTSNLQKQLMMQMYRLTFS